jgi:hypothetical protein
MKHVSQRQQIDLIPTLKGRRPLVTTCRALVLALTITACGQQEQNQQGEKPTVKQSAQTNPNAEKMRKSATQQKQSMTGGAKQIVPLSKMQGMRKSTGNGMQPLSAALKSQSMTSGQPSPEFQALDTNHDGQVTTAEASSNPKLSKMFKALDNGDGQLDKTEFSAFNKKKAVASALGGAPTRKTTSSSAGQNPNRPSH